MIKNRTQGQNELMQSKLEKSLQPSASLNLLNCNSLKILLESTPHQELYTTLSSGLNDTLTFVFNLSGRLRCTLPGSDRHHDVGPDQTLLLFSPTTPPRFECPTNDDVLRVWINIERRHLLPYCRSEDCPVCTQLHRILHSNNREPFVYGSYLSASMKTAVHQLSGCPFKGPLRSIFGESKALELIAYDLKELCSQSLGNCKACSLCRLTPDDMRRIRNARKILIENIEAPPGLEALAGRAGLNVTKLKRGFRQLYGTSVFGYLRAHRMETARRFLEKGEMNVTEAAMTVGYSNVGHFCTAFRKQYGIKPGCCLQKFCFLNDDSNS